MRRRALAVLLLVPLLAACGGTKTAPAVPAATTVDARVIAGNDRFGINLLQALRAKEGERNWFLSPVSASLALGLAASGAGGETQAQMLKGLGLEGLSIDAVSAANRDLQSILTNPDPKVRLTVANSLWTPQGRPLAKAFAERARAAYSAVTNQVPFGQPKAAKQINDWVKTATGGKIPSMIEQTSAEDRLYIINALYFNGSWKKPFEAEWTTAQPFQVLSGETKRIPTMHQGGSYRYLLGDGFQAAVLPFGAGRLGMYLFRPDDQLGLAGFMAKLTPENWATWLKGFAPKQGAIALPKFRLESGAELNGALQSLGMTEPFTSRAEFPGFFGQKGEQLFLSKVVQKTFLAVDETGAEAAAATAVIAPGSAPPTDTFDLRLDHPFFLAIRDDQSGALLFLGTIIDPS